jgi:hypothetical protein
MKALIKAALLSLLLIMAGVPGIARQLCAESSGSHAHACCAAHEQVTGSQGGATSMQSTNPSCCKVAPVNSTPLQNLLSSSVSNDGVVASSAVSDLAGEIPALILLSGRGSPGMAKLQHSPVHALLCTFLV